MPSDLHVEALRRYDKDLPAPICPGFPTCRFLSSDDPRPATDSPPHRHSFFAAAPDLLLNEQPAMGPCVALEPPSSFRSRLRETSPDTALACPYRPRSELAPCRLPLSARRVFPPYPAEAARVNCTNTALFAWARLPFVHARHGNFSETIGGHQAGGQASGSSSFVRGSARRSGELQFCLFAGGCARPCPRRSLHLCSCCSHAATPVREE